MNQECKWFGECVDREVGLGTHSLSQYSSVPSKPYGFGGRKASWKKPVSELRSCVDREVGLGSQSLSQSSPVPNKSYGFGGRKAP